MSVSFLHAIGKPQERLLSGRRATRCLHSCRRGSSSSLSRGRRRSLAARITDMLPGARTAACACVAARKAGGWGFFGSLLGGGGGGAGGGGSQAGGSDTAPSSKAPTPQPNAQPPHRGGGASPPQPPPSRGGGPPPAAAAGEAEGAEAEAAEPEFYFDEAKQRWVFRGQAAPEAPPPPSAPPIIKAPAGEHARGLWGCRLARRVVEILRMGRASIACVAWCGRRWRPRAGRRCGAPARRELALRRCARVRRSCGGRGRRRRRLGRWWLVGSVWRAAAAAVHGQRASAWGVLRARRGGSWRGRRWRLRRGSGGGGSGKAGVEHARRAAAPAAAAAAAVAGAAAGAVWRAACRGGGRAHGHCLVNDGRIDCAREVACWCAAASAALLLRFDTATGKA